ncbi:MAG TPA: hypothetical protein VK210_07840 [Terriglobia bacterium]|nr:hypothetical protein [Terriglobia bacterium]
MSIIKRLCTCIFVLLLLIPAISIHDDAVSLSAFQPGDNSIDDTLVAVRHLAKADFNSTQATLLENLETLHVAPVSALHVQISSTPFHLIETIEGCNYNVAVPVGRAPPAV